MWKFLHKWDLIFYQFLIWEWMVSLALLITKLFFFFIFIGFFFSFKISPNQTLDFYVCKLFHVFLFPHVLLYCCCSTTKKKTCPHSSFQYLIITKNKKIAVIHSHNEDLSVKPLTAYVGNYHNCSLKSPLQMTELLP